MRSAPQVVEDRVFLPSDDLTVALSAAVSFDGHLYTWGCGSNGRLGLGDAVDSSVPQ